MPWEKKAAVRDRALLHWLSTFDSEQEDRIDKRESERPKQDCQRISAGRFLYSIVDGRSTIHLALWSRYYYELDRLSVLEKQEVFDATIHHILNLLCHFVFSLRSQCLIKWGYIQVIRLLSPLLPILKLRVLGSRNDLTSPLRPKNLLFLRMEHRWSSSGNCVLRSLHFWDHTSRA